LERISRGELNLDPTVVGLRSGDRQRRPVLRFVDRWLTRRSVRPRVSRR
jgi:hypothetical protein